MIGIIFAPVWVSSFKTPRAFLNVQKDIRTWNLIQFNDMIVLENALFQGVFTMNETADFFNFKNLWLLRFLF